jgi:hypothetical protein
LISLIANAKTYDGVKVRTTGVLVLEFELQMLYLNPYDADHHVARNGVWLALDKAQVAAWRHLNRKLVDVDGTFDVPAIGFYSSSPNGALIQITSIREHAFRPRIGP